MKFKESKKKFALQKTACLPADNQHDTDFVKIEIFLPIA
jgi:hypothetical protein